MAQKGRFENPVEAVLTGITDFMKQKSNVRPLSEADRLDGKTCMITGANSGVGFAVAMEFAKRGANLIMACRGGIPDAGEKIRAESGSKTVEMMSVDLSDLNSIQRLCAELKEKKIELDVVICNAGIAPAKGRKTPQGLETMFMVNYLAKFILLNQLLKDGTIPNAVFGNNARESNMHRPRIIFTSSDSHRGSTPIDFDLLGIYEEFGVKKAIQLYGYYKLVMNTFATELSRRLNPTEKIDVSIFPMCPGPVNTNITREAPPLLKAFMDFIFSIFFQSPAKASIPLVYLASATEMEGSTNRYLHMMTEKLMDEKIYDEQTGKQLWKQSEDLWKSIL